MQTEIEEKLKVHQSILVLALAAILVAIWWKTSVGYYVALALLCLPLLLYPLARWIHLGWMALAKGLGWINTRLLLGIIFFVLLWPLAALRRVFRSELISKSADPKADTYYKEKEKKSPEAEDFLTPW